MRLFIRENPSEQQHERGRIKTIPSFLAFWKMQHIMWHSVALPEVRGLAMLDGLL